jgi:hypothetical protein
VKARGRSQSLGRYEATVNALDQVCAKIDLQRPTLAMVEKWLREVGNPIKPKQAKGSLWITLVLIAACIGLAWHLAR